MVSFAGFNNSLEQVWEAFLEFLRVYAHYFLHRQQKSVQSCKSCAKTAVVFMFTCNLNYLWRKVFLQVSGH